MTLDRYHTNADVQPGDRVLVGDMGRWFFAKVADFDAEGGMVTIDEDTVEDDLSPEWVREYRNVEKVVSR